LGDGLRVGAVLAVLTLFAAQVTLRGQEGVKKAAPSPPASPEYAIAGHRLRLVITGETCAIEHRTEDSAPTLMLLNLRAPCYLPTWRQAPPERAGRAGFDGAPVGAAGDPMAWRYADRRAVVIAVIGDPVPDDLRSGRLYRLRARQGLHCGASVQAVLVQTGDVQPSKKREQIGVLCNELGLGEKDFWLLAHP
jgi:hypothetical protein